MTEPKQMDAARVEAVLNELGKLLAEQPGALKTFKTKLQDYPPETWWDPKAKQVACYTVAAYVARLMPKQPLPRELGKLIMVALEALTVAQRESNRADWRKTGAELTAESPAKKLSPESVARISGLFDYREEEEADALVQMARANLSRAKLLYEARAQKVRAATLEIVAAERIDQKAIHQKLEASERALAPLQKLFECLSQSSTGLQVPRSHRGWLQFETGLAESLGALGVPKKRVVQVLKRRRKSDEHERTRISRNVRRAAKG